ncbi:MAG: Asp-tRNA(Asn)/Glu-tRNA(Gln) amidotransferase subunit GatA [Alphaproteobacteria bacterium]|jgi:aspartyl-tRNA(Asn)/glutamyl-tRNA(Gln) amidotransferase subunit A|nr:Asp-tRNA(Asn)/Glu-tRNA(Gln) amidotransferase subunit GatA [Alphaproteobacteria bacterium]
MSLLNLSVKELADKLKSKEISSVELTTAYIESSNKADELNIYITKTFDLAMEQAKQSDTRRNKGEPLSDIDGIPLGIKDIFLTKGVKTTNASAFLKDFIAPYESTITQNLLNAGMVSLGKLNLDEFAMGSANLTSHFGPVINPWKLEDGKNRVPGGSSGGSSAAVAARAVPVALGTDTGGSIRQPASFCGLVGMKPTYGTCSRFGTIAFASSLDQAGVLSRNVVDNAMVLNHMAGYDEKDSSMIKFNKQDFLSKIGQSIKGVKIGLPKEYFSDQLSAEIKDYWTKIANALKEEGAEIIDISLPHTQYALAVYYMVAPSEAYSNLARFDGIRYGSRAEAKDLEDTYKQSRKQGWGEEVKRRILIGNYNLLTENFDKYVKAAKIRKLIANDFIDAFKKVDVILTPTTTSPAFAIDEQPSNPLEMYYNDLFTVTANLAGLPAISIPVGLSNNGLPIGMQLIGNYFKESDLYAYSYILEQKAQFSELSSFVKKHNLN